jgi:hypothetical protein
MITRLASLSPVLYFHDAHEVQTEENLQQQIECIHCLDVMTLSSDFDKLLYFCQDCRLLLAIK